MRYIYLNKETRDAKAKELKDQGISIQKSSVRNQLLHPQCVNDYAQETGIVITSADCGFGNIIYKTHFAVLYGIRII